MYDLKTKIILVIIGAAFGAFLYFATTNETRSDEPINTAHAAESNACAKTSEGAYDCTAPVITEKTKNIKWIYDYQEANYTVTGYNSVEWQTDDTPCVAANGEDICALQALGQHSCAAALPFRTRIQIPGLGECVVRDRTAKKYSGRIDWYFGGRDTIKAARRFGKQHLTVKIIYPE